MSALPQRYYPVEIVVMVIRSLACSYVKRDLYWADTILTAACARHVYVCLCVYSVYSVLDETGEAGSGDVFVGE